MTITSNEEAKAWCMTARKLLGKKLIGTGDRGRLVHDVKDIDELLARCKQQGFDTEPEFVELRKKYWAAAEEARKISEAKASDGNARMKKVAKDLTGVTTELRDFEVAQGLKKDYETQLGLARQMQSELEALHWENFDYHKPAVDLIARAGTLASAGKMAEAAETLKSQTKKIKLEESARKQTDVSIDKAYNALLASSRARVGELSVLNRGSRVYDRPVQAIVEDAIEKRRLGKLSEAENLLKTDLPKAYKEQVKLAGSDRTDDLDTVRHKPVFIDKVLRIQEAIDELTGQPGTAEAIGKLNALMKAGRDEEQASGDYEAAYKKLKGLSGALKKGREGLAEFPKKAGDKDFRKLLVDAQARLATFSDAAMVSQPGEVDRHTAELRKILLDLDGSTATDKVQKAMLAIGLLAETLKKLNEEHAALKVECDKLLVKAEKDIRKVREIGSPDTMATGEMAYRQARAASGLGEFVLAKAEFGKLDAAAKAAEKENGTSNAAWLKERDTVLADSMPELRQVVSSVEVQPLSSRAGELLRAFVGVEESVGRTHDFAGALKAASDITAYMPELRRQMKAIEGLAGVKANALEIIAPVRQDCEAQIEKLKGESVDVTTYQKAASAAREAYRSGAVQAVTADAVDQACQAALVQWNDLLEKLEAVKEGTPARAQAQLEGRKKGNRAQLDQTLVPIERELDVLLATYPTDAARLKVFFDEIVRLAAADEAGGKAVDPHHIADAGTLAKEIDKFTREKKLQINATRLQVQKDAKAFTGRVGKLRSKYDKFKDYFAELEAEVLDVGAMADSTVDSVVLAAKARLAEPDGDLAKKVKAAEHSVDFQEVGAKLERLKKLLEDSAVLKLCAPGKRKALLAQLKEGVTTDAYRSTPAAALLVLKDFEELVDAAVLAATGDKGRRDDIARLKQNAMLACEKLPEGTLRDAMRARIDNAAVPAEAREHESMVKLNALIVMLGKLTEDSDEGRARQLEMGKAITEQSFERDKAAKDWAAQVNVFEKNKLRDVDAALDEVPSKDRDQARRKAIGTALDAAKKLAKNGAFLQALVKLDDAGKLADALIASPTNDRTTARNSLGKVAVRWKKALSAFAGEVATLSQKISQSYDPLVDIAIQKSDLDGAVAEIKSIVLGFDAMGFDPLIATLDQQDVRGAVFLKAKEAALVHVRSYRKRLETDMLLKQIEAANPFHPVSSKQLRDTLADLELNFKRA